MQYKVKEKFTCYLVGEFSEELPEVKVGKLTLKTIGKGIEPEKLAVLLAIIKFKRYCENGRPISKTMLKKNLILMLKFRTTENLISEISQMEYSEIMEYFE